MVVHGAGWIGVYIFARRGPSVGGQGKRGVGGGGTGTGGVVWV